VTVAAGSAAWRALEVERALADARLGDLGGGRARVEQVLRDSATEEALTIGRARLARASLLIVADTASSTDQALTDLEVAAAHLRLAGDRAWEADCHQAAGYGCHYTNGRHDAAIEALERSLALRPSPDAGRAEALTYLAEVLIRVGRLEDATVALREARAIANRLGAARAIAYVAWTLADLHAQRRDRRAASAALDEAEAHLAELARSLAEIDFLVDAARIRAVVGDAEGAARDIERAERVARGSAREDVPLMARARYELLFGDPGIALQALGRVDDSAVAYRGERWLRELLRAATYARLGDAERATDSLASARGMVQDEGDPERLSRLEPELLALAARTAPAAPAERLSVTVSMLGRFAVERGGTDVTPPPGRPQMLVKLLALHATLAADEAMELLWPDVDPGTGRARLRNLLNRVRAASGHIVVRGGDALALAPGVIVDAQRFEQAAAKALAARPSERAGLGRAALAWSTGELLPGDRYEDWADVPRERLRRRRLALLDLVADDAAAKGDFDEAARLLDEAIASDPLEGIRYVRLARALLAQGRTRAAMNVAQRGASAADELGTVPSTDLRELISEIARVEGRGAQAGPASVGCRTVGTGFVGQRRARGMAPRSRSGGLVT
jgi:DNA-binding SARP family transcriptional activator